MKNNRLPLLLYALTIFLSAFLLFQVQPIIAKIILPWFGGSAAVWTTCLLFFQMALLGGYLYAHGSIRYLPPVWQQRVHIGLLAVSVLLLHMIPSPALRPHGGDEPTVGILLLLLLTIGLPYFLLSTTSPLLQAWYSAHIRADASAGANAKAFPYRLYALSNVGSLLALCSYPVMIEPRFTLRQQAFGWSAGYACFVVLCILVALRMNSGKREEGKGESRDAFETPPSENGLVVGDEENSSLFPFPSSPPLWMYLLWILLAACSSTLLLAVSNHLSQNVAAIPFLWVLPLSLYLLSFIWCFGGREWQWRKAFLPLPFALIAAMAYALSDDYQNLQIGVLIPLFAVGLFVCCILCHGELARLKPDPRHLTAFYLMISIGGALGGVFVGLLAPHWFPAEWELPIGLGLCAVVALFALYYEPDQKPWELSWVILSLLTLGLLWYLRNNVIQWQKDYDFTTRNFYGVLRVKDTDTDSEDARRVLIYGTIQHGSQYLKADKRDLPISYYGPETGLALAIRTRGTSHPERVGVIGLGTGTIAAFGRPGDVYRYYEINPLVKHLAETKFTFLKDCKAQIDVVMGDARLSMESGSPQNFDVLAVDAFSSDAIPVHLLTKEAFELYFRNLKPDGILAVHVSNRYLDLTPVVASIAQSLGKEAKVITTAEDSDHALSATEWVLVCGAHSFFKSTLIKNAGEDLKAPKDRRTWTDDYSNLFETLKRE